MESLRIAVKDATHYYWDNAHFFLHHIYGKASLKVLFSQNSISFWNATNGCFIDSFTQFRTDERKKVYDWLSHIEKDETQCNECKQWTKEYKRFSFAGCVCTNCYDPTKHLPPYTH